MEMPILKEIFQMDDLGVSSASTILDHRSSLKQHICEDRTQ